MAKAKSSLVVCDAGPLIHLDELQCLDLLHGLGNILIPSVVWTEATRHRPQLSLDCIHNVRVSEAVVAHPSARLIALCDSFDLDVGERAALALIESVSAQLFLCDDAAARLAAESLDVAVRGTIGVLVRSIRVALRTRREIADLLRQLPSQSSLHISRQLLETVIDEVEKASIKA